MSVPREFSISSSLETMARLDERVEAQGDEIEKLHDSHDNLKKVVQDDRVALATALGEIKGSIRAGVWILGALGTLATVALAVLALVLRR